MRKTSQLMRFGVSMENDLLEKFDSLCAARGYKNRSEAIRDMVRDVLIENELRDENSARSRHPDSRIQPPSAGIGRETDRISAPPSQRNHFDRARPFEPHLCLEILLLRGKAKEIKKVADGLIATKGVQHGKLVMTTVGPRKPLIFRNHSFHNSLCRRSPRTLSRFHTCRQAARTWIGKTAGFAETAPPRCAGRRSSGQER